MASAPEVPSTKRLFRTPLSRPLSAGLPFTLEVSYTQCTILEMDTIALFKGFSVTTIKDTWTKPRWRVEAGEGGGFGWGGVERWEKMQTTVIEQ